MPDAPLLRSAAALSDPARLRALRRSGLHDPSADAVFDRYTRMVTRLLGTPIALLSLVEPERQTFKSRVGLDVRETPLSHSFCQHIVDQNAPLIIEDARTHPLVQSSKAIAELGFVAYAGTPVRAPGGEPLGAFCAIASEPRAWSTDDMTVIEELAAAISDEIGLRIQARRFGAFASSTLLGWIAADDTGAVFEVGPTWENVTGSKAAQCADAGWANALHPEDRERVADAWHTAVGKRATFAIDCRLIDCNGAVHPIRLHGAPVWAETRTFTEYVGAFTALG